MKKLILVLCMVLLTASFAIAEDFTLVTPVYPVAQAIKVRVEIDAITMSSVNYTIRWLDVADNQVHVKNLALTGDDYNSIWQVLIPAAAVGKPLGASLNTYIINKIKAIHGI